MRRSLNHVALFAMGIVLMCSWTRAGLTVTSGLKLWLNAGNVDGLNNASVADGSLVSSWTNIAPGASDSAVGSGSARPTFIANGFNGKPVVRFNGTINALVDTAASLDITGDITIFLLMQQTAVAGDGYFGNYGGSNTGYYLNESASGFAFHGGATVTDGAATAAGTLNQPLTIGAVKDATSMSLYVNGSQAGTLNTAIQIASSAEPVGVGNDGRYYPDPAIGDGFWGGDYRDVLIYDRALSESEITLVQEFLQAEALPEPGTLAIFSMGGGLLVLRRRRAAV